MSNWTFKDFKPYFVPSEVAQVKFGYHTSRPGAQFKFLAGFNVPNNTKLVSAINKENFQGVEYQYVQNVDDHTDIEGQISYSGQNGFGVGFGLRTKILSPNFHARFFVDKIDTKGYSFRSQFPVKVTFDPIAMASYTPDTPIFPIARDPNANGLHLEFADKSGNVVQANCYHSGALMPTDLAFAYTTRPQNGVTLSGFVNVPMGQKQSGEFLVRGQVSKQLHPQVVLTISAAVIPPVLSSRPSASFAYEFEVYSA